MPRDPSLPLAKWCSRKCSRRPDNTHPHSSPPLAPGRIINLKVDLICHLRIQNAEGRPCRKPLCLNRCKLNHCSQNCTTEDHTGLTFRGNISDTGRSMIRVRKCIAKMQHAATSEANVLKHVHVDVPNERVHDKHTNDDRKSL